jgi:Carboxypeptidase regulatory-like domain/Chaperone of endosialidase
MGFLLCAANAWAGPASIQGIVRDAKGKPIKGADVRVESRDGKQLFNTVKTDAKGRYVSQGLQAGVYRVSLVVNGAVKASIMNTNARADQATQLNFDLKPASASQASAGQKKGKHKVWVQSSTGSHIGGRWVEVDEGATEAGHLNVKRATGEELQRSQLRGGPQSLPNPSGASSKRFKEHIKPMQQASDVLYALTPVTFRYKKEIDAAGTSQFGLVAEDVEKVNPDLVVRDEEGRPYSVRYDQVNAMLLNEFLKEHRKVEEQGAIIAKQQKQIDTLTTGLQKVSDQLELSKRAPE